MEIVVLSIHLIVCVCLIGLVLLQRSEGGALGIGGGGGGGSLMSGHGAADALAKMTSIAGGFFLVTSLSLTFLSGAAADITNRSVFDNLMPRQESSEPAPAAPEQAEPDRPDPTESSAPQASETDLASISLGPAEAVASPASVDEGAARAGPLAANQQPATAAALRTDPPPQANRPTQTAARTAPPPAAAQPRTQPASAPAEEASEPTRPLNIPNTSGAVSGIALTEDTPFPAESVEVGSGLEAVRRERAGPDQ